MKPGNAKWRWTREPLLHFVALGAIVFAFVRWTEPEAENRITIPEVVVRQFGEAHARRTGKHPSKEEQRAIVQRIVDDEVLYREARALGLDEGDLIIRRRLIQKMQFLTEDLEPIPEPSTEELQQYLDRHRKRFAVPARVSLTHVFASSERGGAEAEKFLLQWRKEIEAGADPAVAGDPFLRGREFRSRSESELEGAFGPEFAATVMSLPLDSWSQPMRSSFGWHLVHVSKRREPHDPDLAEVRETVQRDWTRDRRAEANRAALARLRERYDVQVEWPTPSVAEAAAQ